MSSVFKASLLQELASQVIDSQKAVTLNADQLRQVKEEYTSQVEEGLERIRYCQKQAYENAKAISVI